MSDRLRVAVLGLGEAGSELAAGLAVAGCSVRAWDPAHPPAPAGVLEAESDTDAVRDAQLVLSANSAAVALEAARGVLPVLSPRQLYADLNTGSPALKVQLDELVGRAGAEFADVALLGPVPGTGIRTPTLASGSGADRFAELLGPLGMPVDVVGPEPGAAAGRKLVRSVFMKGLAASVVECLAAAAAAGIDEWARSEIVGALDRPSEALLDRLVVGTHAHAGRRSDEMAAAAAYLSDLGVEPRVARAAQAWLDELAPRSGSSL